MCCWNNPHKSDYDYTGTFNGLKTSAQIFNVEHHTATTADNLY